MKQFKPLKHDADEFFEGFKAPEKYVSFGEVDWDMNMDNVCSNLFVLKKPIDNTLDEILEHFSYLQENSSTSSFNVRKIFSAITTVEGDNFLLVMTFCSAQEEAIHNVVDISNAIQLLDDCTSTNDCLRAFEHLKNDKNTMPEDEYREIYQLLKLQLTEKGLAYIKQYEGLDDEMETVCKKPKM